MRNPEQSLLFADDDVLLASLITDLQLSLEQYTGQCEEAEMKISTSKPDSIILSQKRVDCPP